MAKPDTQKKDSSNRIQVICSHESKPNIDHVGWIALIVAVVGTIGIPIFGPLIEHTLYDREIASFDVNLPSHYYTTSQSRLKIPFAITNYGTVPVKIMKKYVIRDSDERDIILYSEENKEIPFKTLYMEGEGLYGFIYLDKPLNKNTEKVSFCVEYYPAGRFTSYLKDAKGVCTKIYNISWN